MSNEVQELVQKDAGTEDEEETEPPPAVEEPALARTSTVAQPTPAKTIPARTFLSILEEDVVSVKDSVTSGLFAHGSMKGTEVGGSSGHPMTPQFKFGGSFVAGHGSTEDMGKRHSCHKKKKKGSCHWVRWWRRDGRRRITRPLLKNQYRWWANLRECRRPPQGVSHPTLLGLVR